MEYNRDHNWFVLDRCGHFRRKEGLWWETSSSEYWVLIGKLMQKQDAETRCKDNMPRVKVTTINTCHLLGFNGQCFFVRGNGLFTSTAVGQCRTQLVPQTVIVLPVHDGPAETNKQTKQNIQQQQKCRLIDGEQLKNQKKTLHESSYRWNASTALS